jgi:hypothetical protein
VGVEFLPTGGAWLTHEWDSVAATNYRNWVRPVPPDPEHRPELDVLATKLRRAVGDLQFSLHRQANAGVLTLQTWVVSDLAEELHVELGRVPADKRCVIRDDVPDDELPERQGPGLSGRPSTVSSLNRHPTTQRALARRRADRLARKRRPPVG